MLEHKLSQIAIPHYKILTFHLGACRSFILLIFGQKSTRNTISFITNELTGDNLVVVDTVLPKTEFTCSFRSHIHNFWKYIQTFCILNNYISKTFRNQEFSIVCIRTKPCLIFEHFPIQHLNKSCSTYDNNFSKILN